MHRSTLERSRARLEDEAAAPPRVEAAPQPADRPDRLAAAGVAALQRTAGNAAVVRMLTPAPAPVLARTLASKLALPGLSSAPVTPARLTEVWTTIDAAWTEFSADPKQLEQADADKVGRWRTQFGDRIASLRQEIAKGNPPDVEQHGMQMALIKARGDSIAEGFYQCIVSLNLIVNEINRAWDAWKIAEEVAGYQAETSGYKQRAKDREHQEKEKEWKEQAERGTATEAKGEKDEDDDEDDPADIPVGFPHKGKHAPKRKWLGQNVTTVPDVYPVKVLEARTQHPKPAVYKTRNPVQVLEWEQTARDNGLTLYGTVENLARKGGFTVVHGFTEVIGADHGEMTRFIRIDGDHGHPISENFEGLKTSFVSYVKKDVQVAKDAKDMERLHEIWAFLRSLQLATSSFGIKSEPKVPAAS